jgi:hypothetical protein
MKNLYKVFYTTDEGRKESKNVVAESVALAAGSITEGKVNDVKDQGECIVVGK